MQYGFLPFVTTRDAGGRDIRDALRERQNSWLAKRPRISNLQLLDVVAEELSALPYRILVDFCTERKGDLQLAVYAPDLGRDICDGDRVNAGLFISNSESRNQETVFCERIFRMACINGALVEVERLQTRVIGKLDSAAGWKRSIQEIVSRSFDNEGVDADMALFRKTTEEIVASPYEILCNLCSQGLISDDEQSEINIAFQQAGDLSMYGLINAITSIAHGLRANDNWLRSMQIERLGGEVLRGDHRVHSYQYSHV